MLHQGGDSPTLKGVSHIVMPIHPLAFESDKKRARDSAARVYDHVGDYLSVTHHPMTAQRLNDMT
jgi:hypothetical protein